MKAKRLAAVFISCGVIVMLDLALSFYMDSPIVPYSDSSAVMAREALRSYATKHEGKFPDGMSSTEVFQKLVDDGDIDASYLYFPMPGKEPATSRKLMPKNVCLDVTRGANGASPSWLPVVFSSGYRIDFKTGIATRVSPKYSVDYSARLATKYNYWFPNDEPLTVAYADGQTKMFPSTSYYVFFRKEVSSFEIMPQRPQNANVSGYRQLTP